jgi:hypothetical protein
LSGTDRFGQVSAAGSRLTQQEAASPPLITRRAAHATGRPSGPKGAPHRAARDSPAGCP